MQEIRLGDTYYLKIQVTQSDGSPRDLSDITGIIYRMAKSVKSDAYFIQKTLSDLDINIDNPAGGIFVIKLQQADTKTLTAGTAFHEAQIEASNGDIITVMSESIKLVDQLILGT